MPENSTNEQIEIADLKEQLASMEADRDSFVQRRATIEEHIQDIRLICDKALNLPAPIAQGHFDATGIASGVRE